MGGEVKMKVVKESQVRADLRRVLTSAAERAIRTGEAKTPSQFGDMCLSTAEEVFEKILYQNAKNALVAKGGENVTALAASEED